MLMSGAGSSSVTLPAQLSFTWTRNWHSLRCICWPQGESPQAIALAAEGLGLGTCIMGKPVESPNLLRHLTGIPQSDLILCCIAVGYADPNGPINSLPRTRASVEELTVWHGF